MKNFSTIFKITFLSFAFLMLSCSQDNDIMQNNTATTTTTKLNRAAAPVAADAFIFKNFTKSKFQFYLYCNGGTDGFLNQDIEYMQEQSFDPAFDFAAGAPSVSIIENFDSQYTTLTTWSAVNTASYTQIGNIDTTDLMSYNMIAGLPPAPDYFKMVGNKILCSNYLVWF